MRFIPPSSLATAVLLLALSPGPARAAESGAAEIRTTDLAGNAIVLPKPAERIVALPAPSAPTVIAADRSADRLVGMHQTVGEVAKGGLLGRLFPRLNRLPASLLSAGKSAFMPNVEAIAALEPDLVLQRGELGPQIVSPLAEAGLKTALVVYGDEETTRRNIRLMADLTGHPERAEALIGWRDEVLARIRRPDGTAGKKPTVLFLSRLAGHLVVTGQNTPTDFAIAAAGGRNLAAERSGSITVTAEQIMIWDPEVILLNSADRDLQPADIRNDPLLSGTAAAKAGRVYKVPVGAFRWEPPNAENPLFWLWLAKLFHPVANGYDLRAEVRRGIGLVYGGEPTDAEIDRLLLADVNRGALNYDRIVGP
ncbi:iron complex transport system substrate-binding protein [Azospirillum lipoferum]|uniref:ABC transporter substrate-binding protein n=1 Tax=Azospirillum lipoferum TaxID=193 RepID=A0A5A9GWK0_AZOLI|nr:MULTISPECIES: ABC transporter substrate-binding protein [Azospirillum]KAA0598623.1 ABC transporter substrate-binding protein [Azospirillum lipoferum]MCP1609359.1 iron complex transport system substrate-binding protein [Azospirillum lipoferum]MDW5535332.1 ABC transporter substrate-binding protein [Azospirillum sp. NL1]